ncbi:hypothetical protein FDENT_10161 [Fusarium denticulatum]|uniref:Uncharacterized protein n=1 Tax=Fusarium denticulatum TaxID=48507 RepID=A0A8H5TMQ0_9HYPO|nr:hypothetical protein FDENT_10161 [Fusarium denticulatum]
MLTSWFLQLAILAATTLPRLAAAGSDPAAAFGSVAQPSLDLPDAVSNASSTIESEALLEECDPTITVCGTTANVKVELPTSTRTVVSVIVSTNTTNVEGQCRDTTVYIETTPLIVTVDVNTTTTREVIPITNITSVTTSWVPHKKISQCIIKRTSIGLAPGSGYASASPPPSAPSQQPPPATGSADSYNSVQPAPSIPAAGASSAQGSGSKRNFADGWLTVDCLVPHRLLPSNRPPPPLKACPGACMERPLEALLEPQELQLAQVSQGLHVPLMPLMRRVLPRPLRLRPREALGDLRLVIKLHADRHSLVDTWKY